MLAAALLAASAVACARSTVPEAPDAGAPDAGSPDSGTPDAGPFDGGPFDGGPASNGPNTTYSGGTGAGVLPGTATSPVLQTQPANIPLGTVLFVTQVPTYGFSTVASPFGNADGSIYAAPRGGDLLLRYPDGTLRNLTQEAGLGQTGQQGAQSIAVRDPSVHFSATKAVFAMVIGAPAKQYEVNQYYWQLYEVTGLGQGEKAVITKVPHQPASANNINPLYGSDGRILFTSTLVPFDLPGPRLDEYEKAPTVTGLWSLDPASGDLKILFNAPSGAFSPMLDSYGRVLWTNWDHLQRDQQADGKSVIETYHPVDCTDEKLDSSCSRIAAPAQEGVLPQSKEVFPEPRVPNAGANVSGHGFNQFFPWMANEDGADAETLNHVGVEELGGAYAEGVFRDDASLSDLIAIASDTTLHKNTLLLRGQAGFFRLTEDPNKAGRYWFTFSPEFHTFTSGDLGYLDASPGVNPEDMQVVLVTDTGIFPGGEDSLRDGHYRDIVPLSGGTFLAVSTAELESDAGKKFQDARAAQEAALAAHQTYGGAAQVATLYDLRLRKLKTVSGHLTADVPLLAAPVHKDLTWWAPDELITFSGNLWELQPVEVRARTIPGRRASSQLPPAADVFTELGIEPQRLRDWLISKNLALISSFNVTQRDRADKLQPYNLQIKDAQTGAAGAKSVGNGGKVYDVSYFQMVEGDALRGYGGYDANQTVQPGRRLIPQPLQDARVVPWLATSPATAPPGAVKLAADGSMAAFVPAQKPLSWQLTDAAGNAVVRERDWLTFAAGEIRSCHACHGVNKQSQTGAPPPANKPEALRQLLLQWKAANP
jgi:hypothetical protein